MSSSKINLECMKCSVRFGDTNRPIKLGCKFNHIICEICMPSQVPEDSPTFQCEWCAEILNNNQIRVDEHILQIINLLKAKDQIISGKFSSQIQILKGTIRETRDAVKIAESNAESCKNVVKELQNQLKVLKQQNENLKQKELHSIQLLQKLEEIQSKYQQQAANNERLNVELAGNRRETQILKEQLQVMKIQRKESSFMKIELNNLQNYCRDLEQKLSRQIQHSQALQNELKEQNYQLTHYKKFVSEDGINEHLPAVLKYWTGLINRNINKIESTESQESYRQSQSDKNKYKIRKLTRKYTKKFQKNSKQIQNSQQSQKREQASHNEQEDQMNLKIENQAENEHISSKKENKNLQESQQSKIQVKKQQIQNQLNKQHSQNDLYSLIQQSDSDVDNQSKKIEDQPKQKIRTPISSIQDAPIIQNKSNTSHQSRNQALQQNRIEEPNSNTVSLYNKKEVPKGSVGSSKQSSKDNESEPNMSFNNSMRASKVSHSHSQANNYNQYDYFENEDYEEDYMNDPTSQGFYSQNSYVIGQQRFATSSKRNEYINLQRHNQFQQQKYQAQQYQSQQYQAHRYQAHRYQAHRYQAHRYQAQQYDAQYKEAQYYRQNFSQQQQTQNQQYQQNQKQICQPQQMLQRKFIPQYPQNQQYQQNNLKQTQCYDIRGQQYAQQILWKKIQREQQIQQNYPARTVTQYRNNKNFKEDVNKDSIFMLLKSLDKGRRFSDQEIFMIANLQKKKQHAQYKFEMINQIKKTGDKHLQKLYRQLMVCTLSTIKQIQLSHSKISRIVSLKDINTLQKLNLSYNIISKIEGFEDNIHLRELILNDNQIEKIENMAKLREIHIISLHHNRIRKEGAEMVRKSNYDKLQELSIQFVCSSPEENLRCLSIILSKHWPNMRIIYWSTISNEQLQPYKKVVENYNTANRKPQDKLLSIVL